MKISLLVSSLILILFFGCKNSAEPTEQPNGKGVYVNLQSNWEDRWYSSNLSGGRFNWTVFDTETGKPLPDFDVDYEGQIIIESISFEIERADMDSDEPYRINWGLDSLLYWISEDTVECESVGLSNVTLKTYWGYDIVSEGEDLIVSKLDWSVWMQHPIHLYINVFAYVQEN